MSKVKRRGKRRSNLKRRRNKTIDEWLMQTLSRVDSELDNLFGDLRKVDGKYMTVLDLNGDVLTKEDWSEDTIKLSVLRTEVAAKKYEREVDSIYGDVLNILLERIVNNSPDRLAIRTTARKSGFVVDDIILNMIYDKLTVYIDIDGLAERSGIKLIDDLEIVDGNVEVMCNVEY